MQVSFNMLMGWSMCIGNIWTLRAWPVTTVAISKLRRSGHDADDSKNRLLFDEQTTPDTGAFASRAINVTVAMANTDTADTDDSVTIHIVGPADVWFGVGLGSHSLCRHEQSDQWPGGRDYAIVVEGEKAEERQLRYHGPGTVVPHEIRMPRIALGLEARMLNRPLASN